MSDDTPADDSNETEERNLPERLFHGFLDVIEFVLDLF